MTSSSPALNASGGGGTRSLTAAAIARLVGGTVTGDATAAVHAVAPLDRASDGDLSFLANRKYAPLLAGSGASVVLVSPELADAAGTAASRVVVDEPYQAMLKVLPELYPPSDAPPGVHPAAIIGEGGTMGRDVAIGAFAVVGAGVCLGERVVLGPHVTVGDGVVIGDDSRVDAAATLYPGVTLGRRVRVRAGARLGADGFGYVSSEREHCKMPHVGRCVVEDDVEIGANTTIDRGSIDDTVIGAGTKIDNLVHVAHNVRIGRLCLIMAQVGVAGSVRIEDGAVLAGQVGLKGHIVVGKGAQLAGQAGVFGDVPAGEVWSGYPARPHAESLRSHAAVLRLSKIIKRLERLLERERE